MNNKKSLLFSLVILLLVVVVFTFGYSPLKADNSELKEEVESLQRDLSRLQEQENGDQVSDDTVGEIDKRILEIAIPARFDQDDLIEQMSRMASSNNLKIDNVSFGRGTTQNEFIDSVQVALNVSGGLFSFLEFIQELEAQERFYNLQNFTLTIGEEEPRQINFSVNLEVYHS